MQAEGVNHQDRWAVSNTARLSGEGVRKAEQCVSSQVVPSLDAAGGFSDTVSVTSIDPSMVTASRGQGPTPSLLRQRAQKAGSIHRVRERISRSGILSPISVTREFCMTSDPVSSSRPFDRSIFALAALNFFLADARDGLGPFLDGFLASRDR